jgi:hypothetical protein
MRRDHWIEIFRSTGVQTGQSRLHNVKIQCHARALERARMAKHGYSVANLRVVWLASRAVAAARAGGADRDRTDDLKLAKLALSQLSYGPPGQTIGVSNGGPGTS